MDFIYLIFYSIIIIFAVMGFCRGMMKMAVTVLGMAVSVFLVAGLAPEWEAVMRANAFIYENIDKIIKNCSIVLAPEVQACVVQDDMITIFVIRVISYLSMYAMVRIIIKLISGMILKAVELPGLHFLNSLAGGILGVMQGVVALWIVFLIITVCYGYQWGYTCYWMIKEHEVLSLLYDYNALFYLLEILG